MGCGASAAGERIHDTPTMAAPVAADRGVQIQPYSFVDQGSLSRSF